MADNLALLSRLLDKCLKEKLEVWKGALKSKGLRVRKLKTVGKKGNFLLQFAEEV